MRQTIPKKNKKRKELILRQIMKKLLLDDLIIYNPIINYSILIDKILKNFKHFVIANFFNFITFYWYLLLVLILFNFYISTGI